MAIDDFFAFLLPLCWFLFSIPSTEWECVHIHKKGKTMLSSLMRVKNSEKSFSSSKHVVSAAVAASPFLSPSSQMILYHFIYLYSEKSYHKLTIPFSQFNFLWGFDGSNVQQQQHHCVFFLWTQTISNCRSRIGNLKLKIWVLHTKKNTDFLFTVFNFLNSYSFFFIRILRTTDF